MVRCPAPACNDLTLVLRLLQYSAMFRCCLWRVLGPLKTSISAYLLVSVAERRQLGGDEQLPLVRTIVE